MSDSIDREEVDGFVGTLYGAPLLLATVLAAWGPWRPWIRGSLYLVAIVASVAVNQALALSLPRIQDSPGLILADSLSDLLEWLVVMVPASGGRRPDGGHIAGRHGRKRLSMVGSSAAIGSDWHLRWHADRRGHPSGMDSSMYPLFGSFRMALLPKDLRTRGNALTTDGVNRVAILNSW